MNPKNLLFFGTFSLGVALDQATKRWVYANISERGEEIAVIPGWFSLVHSENPGAIFGSLGGAGEWRLLLFFAFTLVAIGIIGHLWWQLPRAARFLPAVYGTILSGAVGNGIDRLIKGEVTDFLLVYTDVPVLSEWLVSNFNTNRWPAFNVADIALVVGVVLFVIHQTFFDREGRDESGDAPAEQPG